MWIGRADNDADCRQAVARHSSTRPGHHPSWRHVDHSGIGRVEVASVLNSWRNLRGDACRRPLVDPRHLRAMPLTVLVDREGRIAISHAGPRSRHQRAPRRIGLFGQVGYRWVRQPILTGVSRIRPWPA
jgi:hypothetical protein